VLAYGGMTGGWDDFDHREYLVFRQRHGPIHAALADEAVGEIPTKTPADILQHEHWYTRFIILSAAQKETLTGWKNAKEKQKIVRALELQEREKRKKCRLEKVIGHSPNLILRQLQIVKS
jgi:hypothetical protein